MTQEKYSQEPPIDRSNYFLVANIFYQTLKNICLKQFHMDFKNLRKSASFRFHEQTKDFQEIFSKNFLPKSRGVYFVK